MGGGAVDVAPNIMVAAGLGKSTDDDGAAGYLVPNLNRNQSTVGPEKLEYYTARITDTVSSYNGIVPLTTNDMRWVAPDGLTILNQETPTKVRIRVYKVGDFDASPPSRSILWNAAKTPHNGRKTDDRKSWGAVHERIPNA
jgi:hypothetical protein